MACYQCRVNRVDELERADIVLTKNLIRENYSYLRNARNSVLSTFFEVFRTTVCHDKNNGLSLSCFDPFKRLHFIKYSEWIALTKNLESNNRDGIFSEKYR